MCYWPDFGAAVRTIELFKDQYLELPPIDVPEEVFKDACDKRWAADDLLNYLSENWYSDTPIEIICDYIEDCKFRAKKYADYPMGKVYETARQTAENIAERFV